MRFCVLVIPLGQHRGAGLLLGAEPFPSSCFLLPESCITQFFVLPEFPITRLSMLVDFSVTRLSVLADFSEPWLSIVAGFLVTRLEFPDFMLPSRLPRLTRVTRFACCPVPPSLLPWLSQVTQSLYQPEYPSRLPRLSLSNPIYPPIRVVFSMNLVNPVRVTRFSSSVCDSCNIP
jgi:hypothetical protein